MNLEKYPNIHLVDHPLLKHKMTLIRKVETNSDVFRKIVKEISLIEGLEALRNIKTKDITINTPLEKTIQPMVDGSKICFVPILRAGLGMLDGFLELIPTAKTGHIGLYRDKDTKLPIEYFVKLPKDIKDMDVYLIDPMLATGGSAIDAINSLKKHGVTKITFICMVAAPEGVEAFSKSCPDIPVYIGALDRELNSNKYILPGLGDAGDRIFGTND